MLLIIVNVMHNVKDSFPTTNKKNKNNSYYYNNAGEIPIIRLRDRKKLSLLSIRNTEVTRK